MDISFSSAESVVEVSYVQEDRVLNLRTNDGELEWKLLYTTELGWQTVVPGSQATEAICLDCKFRLVPVQGMNFMRTTAYTMTLLIDGGKFYHRRSLVVNKEYSRRIEPNGPEKELGKTLTIHVMIDLEMGQVTSVGNSNRLFNNSEQSDVTLKCGDELVIPAHKHVLSYHSETFRTAFGSTNFVEGREGLYEVSSEHMSPDILQDVVRYCDQLLTRRPLKYMVPVQYVLSR
jgi:hypothetical protein